MDNEQSRPVILSVVSPVYNGAKYLEPFLRSVQQQSFPHFELIMVDDGSTDSSIEIIKTYQKKDSRIHLIGQNHRGAGSARNFGLSRAKGQYIIFLDCDDWFSEDFFKTMIDRIEADQSDIAICEFFIYNQQIGEMEKSAIPETGNQKIERTNLVFDIFAPNPWTKLYRISFLKKNKLLFQEIPSCNDWSFAYTSLACAEKISVIRKPLVYYRTKTTTSISSYRYKRTKDIVWAIKHLRQELKSRALFSQYKEGFARKSISHLVYEALSGQGVKVFYVLFRNLLMVNDFAVYKTFVLKVIQFLWKRLNKLIAR